MMDLHVNTPRKGHGSTQPETYGIHDGPKKDNRMSIISFESLCEITIFITSSFKPRDIKYLVTDPAVGPGKVIYFLSDRQTTGSAALYIKVVLVCRNVQFFGREASSLCWALLCLTHGPANRSPAELPNLPPTTQAFWLPQGWK